MAGESHLVASKKIGIINVENETDPTPPNLINPISLIIDESIKPGCGTISALY